MKSNNDIQGMREILYEGRNKSYGAYTLAKNYDRNVSMSSAIAITLFTLIVTYPLIKSLFIVEESIREVSEKVRVIVLENFITEIPADRKEIQLPKNVILKTGTVKFLVPEVKPDELASNETLPTQVELVGNNPGTETVDGNVDGVDVVDDVISSQNSGNETVKSEIYTWVEEMPAFPGGNAQLVKFFSQNLTYPEIAKRAGVEGKVVLSFVVNEKGEIGGIEILKSIGAGCDEEAMRVLKLMPRWNPGKQNGNPVSTKINIPVVFKLR